MTRLSNLNYHNKYSAAAKAMPNITLFFLQASRSIRPAWLLEELGTPYKVEFANRQNQKAPPEFKGKSGNPLGKFPTLQDGELTIHESGAIIEYLCERYDLGHKMIPQDDYLRAQVLTFVHAAEGALMLHGLAVLYAQWNFPADAKEKHPEILKQMEEGLGVNVRADLDWLEGVLDKSTGRYLVGDSVTAADIMMQFSASFILERKLGIAGKSWPKVQEWLARCEATESFKRAVEKTGYMLHPETT